MRIATIVVTVDFGPAGDVTNIELISNCLLWRWL